MPPLLIFRRISKQPQKILYFMELLPPKNGIRQVLWLIADPILTAPEHGDLHQATAFGLFRITERPLGLTRIWKLGCWIAAGVGFVQKQKRVGKFATITSAW